MINMFVKMWVSIFALFIVLGILIIGGDWFQKEYGTGPTIAVFAVVFVVMIFLARTLAGKR